MSTGWILVIMGTVAAAVDLWLARHYMSVTPEDLARKPNPRGHTAAQLNLAGKVLGLVGIFVFLVCVSIGFGLIPTGIDRASFGGAS